jgi:hypothetical protein
LLSRERFSPESGRKKLSMEAINELTIDSPAIEAPKAPPPEEEDAATYGAQDIRPASSGIVNIKDEILQLADHGIYSIPVTIGVTLDEIRCSSARRVRKPRLAFQQT